MAFSDFRPAPNQGARPDHPDAFGLSYGYVLFAIRR
jgi:hypothetical protein